MVVEAQDSGREDQRDLHTNPDHPQPRAEVTPPEKLRPPGWGRWDKLLYEYKKITRILKAVQAPPAYKGRGASGPSRGGAAIFGTAPGARLNTIKVREAHSGPLGGHLYLLSISVLEIISLLKFSGLIGVTTFNYFKNPASEMKTSYPETCFPQKYDHVTPRTRPLCNAIWKVHSDWALFLFRPVSSWATRQREARGAGEVRGLPCLSQPLCSVVGGRR